MTRTLVLLALVAMANALPHNDDTSSSPSKVHLGSDSGILAAAHKDEEMMHALKSIHRKLDFLIQKSQKTENVARVPVPHKRVHDADLLSGDWLSDFQKFYSEGQQVLQGLVDGNCDTICGQTGNVAAYATCVGSKWENVDEGDMAFAFKVYENVLKPCWDSKPTDVYLDVCKSGCNMIKGIDFSAFG